MPLALSLFALPSAFAQACLSPQIQAIVEDVKTACGMNPTQTQKFTADYTSFLNDNAKNLSANAGNPQKRDEETKRLLMKAGASFRSYLNDGQFTTLTKMIQAGKLDPNNRQNGGASSATSQSSPAGNLSAPQGAMKSAAPAALPAAVSTQSNVTSIFMQLSPYLKVSQDQSARTIPILQDYDKQVSDIKSRDAGNTGKMNAELGALNSKTVEALKPILNNDQLGKLIVANTMQENILSGKNLNAEQKAFLAKLQSQYSLNDVQLMSVVLVMVQGKVRGDAINQLAKTNPQAASQQLGVLLNDLDGQLKSALSADQYSKVKSDIEKMLKGQKI